MSFLVLPDRGRAAPVRPPPLLLLPGRPLPLPLPLLLLPLLFLRAATEGAHKQSKEEEEEEEEEGGPWALYAGAGGGGGEGDAHGLSTPGREDKKRRGGMREKQRDHTTGRLSAQKVVGQKREKLEKDI